MTSPPLKTGPKYGYFPWWPEDGDGWVHPDDVATARSMIPSLRIFRRDGNEGEYLAMHYGEMTLRVRRTMWQEVRVEEYDIGDWVEVLPRGMINEPRTGVIREMLWDEGEKGVRYQITANGEPIAQLYAREDFKRVEPIG